MLNENGEAGVNMPIIQVSTKFSVGEIVALLESARQRGEVETTIVDKIIVVQGKDGETRVSYTFSYQNLRPGELVEASLGEAFVGTLEGAREIAAKWHERVAANILKGEFDTVKSS